ncbi:MAG: 2-oxo-4-hydroxy-4-carboxy-5-ureidoimidazoline decarboxylase [Planctomycetota bacterium]|nr:MAG: 2-oxo-4-hydroxy-4-carboxy-5-ureidoimidazoline decarboxylase [Planctomycetota bacterium]
MAIAERINALNAAEATTAMTNCCAAQKWIEAMMACRPFDDDEHVLARAEAIWRQLDGDAWREAFAAHPKIGDLDSLRARFADTRAWAGDEQAGVTGADEEVLRQLARLNGEYENRFGHIFIVCATGKSAAEMLAILQSRIDNAPDKELRIAAEEQLKITLIRLRKLAP